MVSIVVVVGSRDSGTTIIVVVQVGSRSNRTSSSSGRNLFAECK